VKNILELSLLEISVLMREAGSDADVPEAEYTRLISWVRARQQYMHDYKVLLEVRRIKEKGVDITKRAARSLDEELLDHAPIELVSA
jgi:hypothetical protein